MPIVGRDTTVGLAAEYAAMTAEWNRSIDTLDHQLRMVANDRAVAASYTAAAASKTWLAECADRDPERCARQAALGRLNCSVRPSRRRCARTCGFCGSASVEGAASSVSRSCSLVALRHIAKTGGASVRDWMLQREKADLGRFFGPVTWMPYRGRCDGNKRFLHCCHPDDARPVTQCKQVKVTEARALAVSEIAAAGYGDAPSARAAAPASRGVLAVRRRPWRTSSSLLTMLEFHWPDSAIGSWGESHTFLDMLPFMRPEVLPGCRVVVTTVLRDPLTLYTSLQRHQYDAMREYGRAALRERCACNLTACDVLGFVRAFPNFQAWRLTSPRWLVPPLALVNHETMFAAASRLLSRLDVVGVFERLDDWLKLVCRRAGISPCGGLRRLNAKRTTSKTHGCAPPGASTLASTVAAHALADVRLHAMATQRFADAFNTDWT